MMSHMTWWVSILLFRYDAWVCYSDVFHLWSDKYSEVAGKLEKKIIFFKVGQKFIWKIGQSGIITKYGPLPIYWCMSPSLKLFSRLKVWVITSFYILLILRGCNACLPKMLPPAWVSKQIKDWENEQY